MTQGASSRVDSTPLVTGALVMGVAGHGVMGSTVPATGSDGPSLIYPYLALPFDNTVEVRIVATAVSSGVTIKLSEDGSGVVTVPSDGTHWIDYGIYKAGALFQTDRAVFNVGVTPSIMAATESGSDTATIFGQVINSGVFNATESGSDRASIFADGATNSGQLNVSESGSDTALILGGFPFSKAVVMRRMVVDSSVMRVLIPAE